ncbi:hypothetical protein Taro_022383 [Colocasia esculenta]|uniref:MORF/ORRM1/DAG-like MORF domain-containing protein n=1 Tax=Colocasia esculenta TaxID=4460 RepID=A0A843V5A1_COLES|nr:hypothetical protein [Colocasia esculenta]
MIDCYIQTHEKFVGSEEEAKKKIYSVCCDRYFGFGCEIDEETSKKLEGHPLGLNYGAELFMNGEIVQRPFERQCRFELAGIYM